MKKWWILAAGLALMPAVLSAQAWTRRYNGPGNSQDKAAAMVCDAAGNIYVTGFSAGSGTGHDFLTIKYNPDGDTLWTRRYSSPGNTDDEAAGIVYDRAGYVIVAGFATVSNPDFLTIKYHAATGDTAWVRRLNGAGDGADKALGLALDDSGYVYVAGYAQVNDNHREATVVQYSPVGVQRWVSGVALPIGDTASAAVAVAVDRNRNACICGTQRDTAGRKDYLIAKLTPLAGDTAWVRRYDGPNHNNDSACAIGVDAAGNIIVTGTSWGGSTTVYDYLTAKYSPTGDTIWTRRYDYAPQNGVDIPAALCLDPAGNIYVTGSSEGVHDEDYATLKYTGTGSQSWVARYNGGSNGVDEAKAIAWEASGRVCVTGYSESGNDYDVYTIQYDTLGAYRWSHRCDYAPPHEDDQGAAIALPNSGFTYVSGFSVGNGTDYDYLTLKYIMHDVGVASINYPNDTLTPRPVVPEVTIHNYGVLTETLAVFLWISRLGSPPGYADVQMVYGLASNSDRDVSFRYFVSDVGDYAIRCSVGLAGDVNRANDTMSAPFTFRWNTYPIWTLMPSYLPPGPNGKFIKDGGCLAFGRRSGAAYAVYALKGNNTKEFYRYDVSGDTWHMLDSIHYSQYDRKRVKKGASLAYDRYDTLLFALKGNNTLEFWKYDICYPAWLQKNNIPLGFSLKKVKGGGSLVFWHKGTGDDYLYALKGSKTNELWGFHVQGDTWFPRNVVPYGLSGKGMGDGSCLVNASGTFYALKGSYNELYAYYPNGDSWVAKKSLPLVGFSGRKKKAKDGSALCYDSDHKCIYAAKGGCDEFWAYYPGADTWIQQQSIPLAPSYRYFKSGGALAYGYGYAWAFKGNKTVEFWTYDPGSDRMRAQPPGTVNPQVAGIEPEADNWSLSVTPNPAQGIARIVLPALGAQARLLVYDAAGRLVRELAASPEERVLTFDRAGLSAGVYLLRLEAGGRSLVRKLVIE